MKAACLVIVLAVCSLACARIVLEPTYAEHLRTHPVEHVEWEARGCGNENIAVLIAVKQQNRKAFEAQVLEIATPGSPTFREYLTRDEMGAVLQPTERSLLEVMDWLRLEGVDPASVSLFAPFNDYVRVELSASHAEKIFHTSMRCFSHRHGDVWTARAISPYSVPDHVAEHIDLVIGMHSLPSLSRPTRKLVDNAASLITPSDIWKTMNISIQHNTTVDNSQAVAEFLAQYFSQADLTTYLTNNGLPDAQPTLLGPDNMDKPGAEAELDIQVIMGTAVGVPTWFVSQRGGFVIDPFLEYMLRMLYFVNNPPYVHSVSYSDVEADLRPEYLDRTSGEFQKFGGFGRSILFSSGDDGTGCSECSAFVPNWPTCDPWVTSVGGVVLEQVSPFTASGDVISSGGFSNHFAMPQWQQSAVSAYLSSSPSLPQSTYFNSSGRAYPDVSSFSEDVEIVINGVTLGIGGTSAACPITAAGFALINDVYFSKGQAPLGFLNPWIYSTYASSPSAFYDPTTGSNMNGCCAPGFSCQKGWDPVTGVGVPNIGLLLTL